VKKRPWEVVPVEIRWASEHDRKRPWEHITVDHRTVVEAAVDAAPATQARREEAHGASRSTIEDKQQLIAELRAIVNAA